MRQMITQEIRAFILNRVANTLEAKGLGIEDVPDDFDLLAEGVIDSLGILEMTLAIEEYLGFEIDYEDLDVEDLTIVGPLCRFVEEKARNPS